MAQNSQSQINLEQPLIEASAKTKLWILGVIFMVIDILAFGGIIVIIVAGNVEFLYPIVIVPVVFLVATILLLPINAQVQEISLNE
ncbi:MAG: hypothetical protein EZS28_050442 [Streblomastix strix]|uniref:Uncharacterized protein n=1 Tax=Streblomastix strix TaxID=222440 RepID=A0A5J4T8J5_9EUKA|nr:MAG: hypothetical protein EZS28_050442 [Streblomastix strix]